MGAGFSGATVINGADGFGRRGKSSLRLEGISINYPLRIEVVDEQSKLDPLLPQIKRMVADNTRSVCTMISNNSIEFGRRMKDLIVSTHVNAVFYLIDKSGPVAGFESTTLAFSRLFFIFF